MSSDKSLRDQNINNDEFNYDKELAYEIERVHRNSADSERTLYVPYVSISDLRDAFESSIYDKPEKRTCDCATKLAKKKLENQNQITHSEPSQPQQEHQVYILLFLISIISYAIGYFGFTFVWLLIVLYQFVIWYINVAKENKERVRWEIKREMSIDKVTYKIIYVISIIFIIYVNTNIK
jgi:hypothetical protein